MSENAPKVFIAGEDQQPASCLPRLLWLAIPCLALGVGAFIGIRKWSSDQQPPATVLPKAKPKAAEHFSNDDLIAIHNFFVALRLAESKVGYPAKRALAEFIKEGKDAQPNERQLIKAECKVMLDYLKVIDAPESLKPLLRATILKIEAQIAFADTRDYVERAAHRPKLTAATLAADDEMGRGHVGLCLDYCAAFAAHAKEGAHDDMLKANTVDSATVQHVREYATAKRNYKLASGHTLQELQKHPSLRGLAISPKWHEGLLQIHAEGTYQDHAIHAIWLVDSRARSLKAQGLDAKVLDTLKIPISMHEKDSN